MTSNYDEWAKAVATERKCVAEGHERVAFVYCGRCELMEIGIPASELVQAVKAFIRAAEGESLVLPVGLIPAWMNLKAALELPGANHVKAGTAVEGTGEAYAYTNKELAAIAALGGVE